MKILIADDEVENTEVLQRMIKPIGSSIIVKNGIEALESFKQEMLDGKPFDLVLMDIMMPEMDGKEAVRHIRDFEEQNGVLPTHQAKVFMVTCLDSAEDIMESFYSSGCTDYITKPFTRKELFRKLQDNGIPIL